MVYKTWISNLGYIHFLFLYKISRAAIDIYCAFTVHKDFARYELNIWEFFMMKGNVIDQNIVKLHIIPAPGFSIAAPLAFWVR